VLDCKVEWVDETSSVYITKDNSKKDKTDKIIEYACAQLITKKAEFYTFTDDAIYYINKAQQNEEQYLYKYDYNSEPEKITDIKGLTANNMKGYTINALETDTVTGDVWMCGYFTQDVTGVGTALYNVKDLSYIAVNEIDTSIKDFNLHAVSDNKALIGDIVINLTDKKVEETCENLKGDMFFGYKGEFYSVITSANKATVYKINDYENKIYTTEKFSSYGVWDGCLYIRNNENIVCISLENPEDVKITDLKLNLNLKFKNQIERFNQIGRKIYVKDEMVMIYSNDTDSFSVIADKEVVDELVSKADGFKTSSLKVLAEDIILNDYVIKDDNVIYINNVIDSAEWVKDNKVYGVNIKTGEKSVLFDFENYEFEGYTGFIPEYIVKDEYTNRIFVSGQAEKHGDKSAGKCALFEISEEPRFICITGNIKNGHKVYYVNSNKEILCGNNMYDIETGKETKVNVSVGTGKDEEAVLFEAENKHIKLVKYLQNPNPKYSESKKYGTAIEVFKKNNFERIYINRSELKFYAQTADSLYIWVYDEETSKENCLKFRFTDILNSKSCNPYSVESSLLQADCAYPEGLEYKNMIDRLLVIGENEFAVYDEKEDRIMILSNN